ncbi:MAG: hypothetical protein ABL921_22415 [Pirellula sp.]
MKNNMIVGLFLASVLFLGGCSDSGLVSVKGTVTFNKKPVTSGTISFISDDNATAYGNLKADGSYELMTERPGDGARPGSYKVIVVAMQDQENLLPEQRSPLPAPTVPFKYTSLATTDLTAKVEKKANKIDFDLTGTLGK